jgi:hypothetical protein
MMASTRQLCESGEAILRWDDPTALSGVLAGIYAADNLTPARCQPAGKLTCDLTSLCRTRGPQPAWGGF